MRALLVAVVSVAVAAGAAADSSQDVGAPAMPFAVVMSSSTADSVERLIVAVIVRGEGTGTLDLVRDAGVFYLPVEPFAEMTGARAVQQPDGLKLETSLGVVQIPADELREFDGALHLSETVLEERLVTRFRFDLEEFAVRLDVPWEPLVKGEEDRPVVTPEVAAPRGGLSRLRLDLQQSMVGSDSVVAGNATLAGLVAGGRWSLRSQAGDGIDPYVEDFVWARDFEQTLLQIGHQRIRISGLTPTVNLTGAQLAWTNQDLGTIDRFIYQGLLLQDTQMPGTTVRGSGPPAGFAQLRVDGAPVDVQVIGLDGRYEFPDVVLPGGRLARVEVYLYDRSNLAVPVRIDDASQSTWERLLPVGAVVHQGAVGVGGNLLRDGGSQDGDLTGFYQGRFGLNERLTVETAVQRTSDRTIALGGVVARLGRSLLSSVTVGTSGEATGYEAVIENVRLPWRLLGQSRWREAGFTSPDSTEESDHWLEIGYQPSPKLDLALYVRRREQGGETTEYLLPGLNWYPIQQLNLRVRPDANGDYRYDAYLFLGRSLRAAVSRSTDSTGANLQYFLPDRTYQIRLSADFFDESFDRYSALVSRTRTGRWSPTWEAGLTSRNSDTGVVARVSVPVMPGILLGADYQDDTAFGSGGDARVVLRVTADLAYSQGQFTAADSLSNRQDVGSLTGRIRVDAPEGYRRPSLGGVLIEVDRRPSTRTETDGSFYRGNLPPGIYRVRIDPGELPIELTPVRTSYLVEVTEGAATRVDFVVRPLFGLAGRVTTPDGARLAGVRVEVVDPAGEVIGYGITDRFGLYRVDGLSIGRCTVRVADHPKASLAVELVDDFLFGKDLVVEGWQPDPAQSE
jgi:hypothetical protein